MARTILDPLFASMASLPRTDEEQSQRPRCAVIIDPQFTRLYGGDKGTYVNDREARAQLAQDVAKLGAMRRLSALHDRVTQPVAKRRPARGRQL